MPSHIGTLTEKSLHAALKQHLARPGDLFETAVEGFVIDILRGDQLIEVQTGSFSPLKRKFTVLLERAYHIHLVVPIAAEKWIVKETVEGTRINRRRSPHRGRPADVFNQLVRIPALLPLPNFTMEVLLTSQEEIRRDDGQGSWRRKGWSLHDHRLIEICSRVNFGGRQDYMQFIPAELPRPFSNRGLAQACGLPMRLAQKMSYTLLHAGWLSRAGKQGNAFLFTDAA